MSILPFIGETTAQFSYTSGYPNFSPVRVLGMKALRLHEYSGYEGLTLDEVERPQPGPGEALIRVGAAALTRDQLPYLHGNDYGGGAQSDLPCGFGYEAAGEVVEVGAGVSRELIGTRVNSLGAFDQARYPLMAEYGVVPADVLHPIPGDLDMAHAAALWVPLLTAYGVIYAGGLRQGDVLALPAGLSTVGVFATQIAHTAGCRVIATTRDAAKRDLAHEAGIDEVIITSEQDYVQAVLDYAPDGVDVSFDPIGGDFLTDVCAATRRKGTVVEYGVLSGNPGLFPQNEVLGKSLTLRGFTVGELVSSPADRAEALSWLIPHIEQGDITPSVAGVYPPSAVQEAFAEVLENKQLGRVVIDWSDC